MASTLKLQLGISLMCKSLQNQVFKTCFVRGTHKYTHVNISKSYNKYSSVYRNLHGTVDDQTIAKDFVYALKDNERLLLLEELQKFEQIKKTEGKVVEVKKCFYFHIGNTFYHFISSSISTYHHTIANQSLC